MHHGRQQHCESEVPCPVAGPSGRIRVEGSNPKSSSQTVYIPSRGPCSVLFSYVSLTPLAFKGSALKLGAEIEDFGRVGEELWYWYRNPKP